MALAAGVLAAVGVGVWNAVELRLLREQLTVKAEAPAAATAPTAEVGDWPARPELPDYTVEAPDILRIALKADPKAVQQIRGEYLIRPDGDISLGVYGSVSVAGMTLPRVKACVERHLGQFLLEPEVSVDVAAFNSKWYYVITDFAGSGENVVRLPLTGNDTVLDAVAQIDGLKIDGEVKVWIARPAPTGAGVDQILPVDWKGITRRGHTRTNYQILPGDRVYAKKAG